MEADSWDKVKEIFLDALELAPEKRRAFLDTTYDGNEELRREVESLLAAHEEANELYETPVLNISTALETEKGDAAERVGAYRIEKEIGRGGMGAVYLASRDDDQFKKQVAVKFIRRTADNSEAIRRFRYERQILAALEHPNIARLLDSGTAQDGLPYLVMEYVDGLPLTEFCEQKQLSLTERLKLFLKICGAVHYAHQHLVIHRDLKPSNILVTADGEPQLLDFGVAKLSNPDLIADATATLPANRLLTPQYASPEQVRGDAVSTATDVYSLGVILYQLLTGTSPFELGNKGFDEIARIISETNPPRPSAVVSGQGTGDSRASGKHHEQLTTDSGQPTNQKSQIQNQKSLKGDLDNIILMAMRKEPARRYKSVEQFAEDIRRHLDGLPVIAQQDTFKYRAGKFIRRNRLGVAAAAIILLAILTGAAATLWQSSVARRQARIAAGERDRARLAQTRAERINDFLQKMFASAAPKNAGREVKVVEVLEPAEKEARRELADQPEILAAILSAIGSTYNNLAQHAEAERDMRDALALYNQFSDKDNRIAAAECAGNLADVLLAIDKPAEAEPFVRQAVEIQRRFEPETDKNLSISLIQLGRTLIKKGDDQAAEPVLQEGLKLARKVVGEDSEVALFALNQLAVLHNKAGDFAGATNIYRQIIPLLRQNPAAKSNLAISLMNLGDALVETGNLNEGENLLQEGFALLREIYGDENLYTANATAKIARVRFAQARYAEAQTEAEKALAMQQKFLPPEHPNTVLTLRVLGNALTRQGQPALGEPYLRKAVAVALKNNKPGSWQVGNLESQLGECLLAQNRRAEAEPLLRQSYEKLKAALGEQHPMTRDATQRIAQLH